VTDPVARGEVNTAVSQADTLSSSAIISSIGAGTLGKISGLQILDGIAPVINTAWYQIDTATNGRIDTTVTVLYSEPTAALTASGANHPFGFYDVSNTAEFSMELSSSATKSNSFTVTYQSIDYVVDGDSIRIQKALSVYDTTGNAQSLSIWAPIRVSLQYAIDIQILIYPQPLVINKDSKDRLSVKELDPLMRQHYRFQENGISDQEGVAFVVEATGPLAADGNHTASATILDQTGNVVSEKFTFVFGTKVGGNLAGVAVWDGKNKSGRMVGAGSYLLAVEASVETDEGTNSRVIQKSAIKTVGVNYR